MNALHAHPSTAHLLLALCSMTAFEYRYAGGMRESRPCWAFAVPSCGETGGPTSPLSHSSKLSTMLLRLATQADQPARRASAAACRSVTLTSSSLPCRRAPACRAPLTAALAPSLAAEALASASSACLHGTITGLPSLCLWRPEGYCSQSCSLPALPADLASRSPAGDFVVLGCSQCQSC